MLWIKEMKKCNPLSKKMVAMLLFFWSQDWFLQLFDSEVELFMLVISFSNISSFALLVWLGREKMCAMYQENFQMKNVCIS